MTLSEEQRRAVERTGQNVCVVAGPGSGKTRVLVERFAWLVEQCHVDPGRILAITFTERAATEMKTRLTTRLPGRRQEVERASVATIDAFCMGVLRENCLAAGLPPDFTVLDPAAAARMERDAAEAALDAMFVERPAAMRTLMEALDLATDDGGRRPDLAATLMEIYETMRLSWVRELPESLGAPDVWPRARELVRAIRDDPKDNKCREWAEDFLALPAEPVTLDHFRAIAKVKVNLNDFKKGALREAAREWREQVQPQLEGQWAQAWYAGLPELLRAAVGRLDREYREAKRREAATDFADLEEKLIELLESDASVRRRVQDQFDHVLMDELQDTNRLQWRLVTLVRGTKAVLFAVGDINQSVYAFRHADRTVFQEYRAAVRAGGGVIDELHENYRSRSEILDAVSAALEGQPGIEARTLTAAGEFTEANPPVVERLVGRGERREGVEASLVARRICEIHGETGCRLSDFAILVRTFNATPPFERALDRSGIPFVVSGGRTFLEARETRDLMALLAALVNPLDEIALLGVLRSPLVGWGDEQILKAGRDGWLQEFEKLFGRLRRLAGVAAPDRLLAMAVDECGYTANLPERAVSNIGKLLGWLRREHRRRPRPLAELLEEIEALRKSQRESEAPPPEAADAVRIFTIHAAKGLEFPVVFVGALQKGGDTRGRAILFSAERGLGVKWRNPVTGKGVADATHEALSDLNKVEESEEASRLLYVAMTRAEQRLVLSHTEVKKTVAWVTRAEAAVVDSTEADEVVESKLERLGVETAEVQALDRAPVREQYDSSASVTSVALFEACPRKYYLARYLGLEAEPDGAGTGAMELGTEVHKALAGGGTESAEARELAARFAKGALGLRAARASRKEREFDFLLPVEDVMLRGSIDLWFEEGGELVLVDYKTDRDESRAGEYGLQLRLYALALERYAERVPERAALCYLRSGREVEVGLSAGELEAAKASVRALRDAQDSLEFPMKVGEQCRRCPFYGGLCKAEI